MAIFLQKGDFPIFRNTAYTYVLKQKVLIIERHMTPFLREEIWGYNIPQNENFDPDPPPIALNTHRTKSFDN